MNRTYITLATLGLLILLLVSLAPWYTIAPGTAAIHLRLGKLSSIDKDPGIYWLVPIIDTVIKEDMRIQKTIIKTEAFSRDLQSVDIEVAINHRINDLWALYKNIGTEYRAVVIDPFTQESVKAVIAKFTAEELTVLRDTAKEAIKADLHRTLEAVHINLVDFNFVHIDFHSDFIKAIESKQIAEQRAKQAKHETELANERAIQQRMKADADSYALKVQKEQVTPKLAMLKAIEKWDGKLPKIITSNVMASLPMNMDKE